VSVASSSRWRFDGCPSCRPPSNRPVKLGHVVPSGLPETPSIVPRSGTPHTATWPVANNARAEGGLRAFVCPNFLGPPLGSQECAHGSGLVGPLNPKVSTAVFHAHGPLELPPRSKPADRMHAASPPPPCVPNPRAHLACPCGAPVGVQILYAPMNRPPSRHGLADSCEWPHARTKGSRHVARGTSSSITMGPARFSLLLHGAAIASPGPSAPAGRHEWAITHAMPFREGALGHVPLLAPAAIPNSAIAVSA
jgi:hypothetical protein